MIRVGVGYDSHRFDDTRPLILGGVAIPGHAGLAGHSDADAVCHAITDALLGATAIGDIGAFFPDTDPANEGADSLAMLERVVVALGESGFRPVNVDVTVVAESPKIGPFVAAIRERLSPTLGLAAGDISIKGKTNEGMGWIGRGEGIAVIAVAAVAPAET